MQESYFCWNNEPVIRNEVLESGNGYWGERPKSAFLANEDESDTLLPFLRKVLESDKADYWEPLEPDIILALYPDAYFPFLESHLTLVHESEKIRQEREERKKQKAKMGKLPDDLFTLIVFVDSYNFKGADAYYGQGFSLQMIVERHKIETFADELESEYIAFKKRFKVDEYQVYTI